MPLIYLKKVLRSHLVGDIEVGNTVQAMLAWIEEVGDDAAREYAAKYDRYDGNLILTPEEIAAAHRAVSRRIKKDTQLAHDNVRRLAEMQKAALHDVELEVGSGLMAGQRNIPCRAAGCYIPGGKHSHVASALMAVTTAAVAGVDNIVACSPPRPGIGIAPEIVYAADIAGADTILAMGGAQGVASMVFGLFGLARADIIVGPGTEFVVEAKRLLHGRGGIDTVALRADSLILADKTADVDIVAADLVGQAERGSSSLVWLVTDDHALAANVLKSVPDLIAVLPSINRQKAQSAWRDYAEVIVCDSREEMAQISDNHAPEHVTVQADNLNWWLHRLKCYGSLFLGEETTVAHGDKSSATTHVLPMVAAANYKGSLSVHKYMKTVTWQQSTRDGSKSVAKATARTSRLAGMEGHARAADIRLAKYFPKETFDLAADG